MGKYGAGPLNLLEAARLVGESRYPGGKKTRPSRSLRGDQTCQGQGPG